jgi:hypothetical protein
MKTHATKRFLIIEGPVVIRFEPTSMQGYYSVGIVCDASKDSCMIPLLLERSDIRSSLLKLRKLKKNQKTSFNVFCKIVAGAILLSMKYKR